MAFDGFHLPGCTATHERKYDCLYCGRRTSQAPVLRPPMEGGDFEYGDRVYPSCCPRCMEAGLWRDLRVSEASREILEQARALPACPMDDVDHHCSVRSAIIQSAYDVIMKTRGWKSDAS
jgi:hypothetical protein